MGWHVHWLDRKYNIWSTVSDSYLFDVWVDEDEIVKHFIHEAIESAHKNAKFHIKRCHEHNCSAGYPARHSLSEIKKLAAMQLTG